MRVKLLATLVVSADKRTYMKNSIIEGSDVTPAIKKELKLKTGTCLDITPKPAAKSEPTEAEKKAAADAAAKKKADVEAKRKAAANKKKAAADKKKADAAAKKKAAEADKK